MNRKQRRAAASQPGAVSAGPAPGGDMIDRQFSLAMQNLQSGRLDLAEAGLRQVIQAVPNHVDALGALGFVLHRAGAHQPALAPIQAALALRPAFADGHATLGSVYQALGRTAEAIDSYRRALALEPRYGSVLCNLGNVLQTVGRLDESVDCYQRALAISPNDATVHANLGSALKALGRVDEAIASFERALALQPGLLHAQANLANAMMVKGSWDEAVALYRTIIAVQPGLPGVLSNLGMVLRAQGSMEEAVDIYRRSLAINPADPAAHANLGNLLADLGQLAEAHASYERAIALKPDYAEVRSNIVMQLNYDPAIDALALYEAHRAFDRQIAPAPQQIQRGHVNSRDPERRLRIGYVSSDFSTHPVGYYLLPVLASHDPAAVEIHCYSGRLVDDAMTTRLRSHAQHWHSTVGVDDDALAAQIVADGIDILVDLAGHTAGNRLPVFARKPAPIQASWLGYPATTGLDAIDYRLTDARADPAPEAERYHTETLVRLPNGFHCYVPAETTPDVASLPARASGSVTFGSFNNLSKINDAVIACWSRLLMALPSSRLIVKARPLNDAATRARYQAKFESAGAATDRLRLLPTEQSWSAHMAQYDAIDIALDPFPYNGTTTTCDALWMGVPVITWSGDRHAARVGASLLTTVGLPELIARDPDDYLAKAMALAGDLDRLANLRAGLRARLQASPLCDATGFARALEAAYRGMWRNWCDATR